MRDLRTVVVLIVAVVVIVAPGFARASLRETVESCKAELQSLKSEAVKRGMGEWDVDEEGTAHFRFIEGNGRGEPYRHTPQEDTVPKKRK